MINHQMSTRKKEYHMKRKLALFAALLGLAMLSGCYYDNEEDLYPQNSTCDTTNVTYSTTVFPLISSRCTGCHTGIGAGGNVPLDGYDNIVAAAKNGSLMGSIRHESGWSPMPKNTGQLDDCSIRKLEIWIADGTPNN